MEFPFRAARFLSAHVPFLLLPRATGSLIVIRSLLVNSESQARLGPAPPLTLIVPRCLQGPAACLSASGGFASAIALLLWLCMNDKRALSTRVQRYRNVVSPESWNSVFGADFPQTNCGGSLAEKLQQVSFNRLQQNQEVPWGRAELCCLQRQEAARHWRLAG